MDVVYVFIGISILSVCFYMALTIGSWIDKAESQSSKLSGLSDDDLLAEVDAKMDNIEREQDFLQDSAYWRGIERGSRVLVGGDVADVFSVEKLYAHNPERLKRYLSWKAEDHRRKNLRSVKQNDNVDRWVAEAIESSSEQE